jgi:hypothetical protein
MTERANRLMAVRTGGWAVSPQTETKLSEMAINQ